VPRLGAYISKASRASALVPSNRHHSVPRQMSQEREREYAELSGYIDFYATHVAGIAPENPNHPTNVGKLVVAKLGRSKALDGLRQAVNDTVEELASRPPEYLRKLDSSLRKQGLPTFSEIRRRYASAYKRILKRRKLNSETEYYLVAGILADVSSLVDDDERVLLNQMVAQYERRDD
jgi:hypothetical protein